MWSLLNNFLPPTAGRLVSVVAALIALLPFALSAHAATVAFGSYLNEAFAGDSARITAEALRVETRLVPATVNGVRYLRVLGPSGLSVAEARDLLRRARASGFSAAWFIPSEDPGQDPEQQPELHVAPSVATPAAPVATRTPVPEAATAPPPSTIEATPELPSAMPPEIEKIEPRQMAAGGAPVHLLLTATGLENGASIVVPRFEEDEVGFRLDGELNEAVWKQVPGYDGMRVLEPDTLVEARYKTVMRYFYTSQALYVSMYAEQPPDTLIERWSARDDFFLRDSMSVTLDTSGEGTYGYWFSVSLGGALADGKIAPERQYSREWDGPWDGATARHEDGWTAEMVLPWSMMAMPKSDGIREIGIYASRQLGYVDERLGFPALPSTGARFMSALQKLEFEDVKPKRQLDLYPYASGTYDAAAGKGEPKLGADLFWRPSTNLQVSGTLNPDFGAVETDDVVINLTATETFFPERRLFFLEGNEIFITTPRSSPRSGGDRLTGSRRTTQLFIPEPIQILNTKRIGAGADVTIPPDVFVPGFELAKPTDLLGALKATGQIGGFRYGAEVAFEDDVQLQGINADGEEVAVDAVGRDFGIVRLLYENIDRGRKSIGYIGTQVQTANYDATVHGADAHYLSTNGKLQLDLQLLASDVDSEKGYGGLFDLKYTQRRGVVHSLTLDAQDKKLDINDLGFLRRNDNYGGSYSFNYTRSQGLKTLRLYNLSINTSYWENADGLATRYGTFFRNTFTFKNLFSIRTELDYFPKRWDDLESKGNGDYRIGDRWVTDINFGTDTSKALSFSGRLGARQEELGGWTYSTAVGVTFKPNHRFSLDLDLNYFDRDGWLLHQQGREFTTFAAQDFQPRMGVDWFPSARQQLRMSLQWAAIKARDQEYWRVPEGGGYLIPVIRDPDEPSDDFVINRMTLQLRYRWQIAPLSDLYVVYTRGSNIRSMLEDDFGQLFQDALREPVIDFLVVKLRYRLGV